MPNWCNNTVEIYHDDPIMLERVRSSFKNGALLAEFIPIPEELNITAGRSGSIFGAQRSRSGGVAGLIYFELPHALVPVSGRKKGFHC